MTIEFNEDMECFCKREIKAYAPYLKKIPKDILNKFQIICDSNFYQEESIYKKLNQNKIRILWIHSYPIQNEQILNSLEIEPKPLANGGWNKFHKIIFISHHQMENWINTYNIPRSHCNVMKHALEPIELQKKPKDKIVLVYHSNPQRGLSLLVDVFERLCEEYDNIELKVHSSLKIYNDKDNLLMKNALDWEEGYKKSDLYERLEKHSKIHNIGYLPNEELKKSLASSHIFAYPNIFVETFCLSLLEAMSAGCLCVHPNFGCLPETASNWTMMYDYHDKIILHKEIFYQHLKKAIDIVNNKKTQKHLKMQKEYVDYLFNSERRTQDWINLLESLKDLQLNKIPKSTSFYYN
jgi:glycosyltransferase involved in cell wall biosynthesis